MELPGYVALFTGPAQKDQDLQGHRGTHCKHVAKQVEKLVHDMPGRNIAVLCRTNSTIARMIYELRNALSRLAKKGAIR